MHRLLALLLLPGCLTLDSFVFNGIPCAEVGPDTCDPDAPAWDRVCVPCSDTYDWQRDYPWFPQTLAAGESIRPIGEGSVTQVPIALDGGTADAVFLTGHGPNAEITVLYNHGNYASIEHYQPRIRMLHEAGYSIFAWDYRGYGKTEPATYPTASEFMADAMAARDAVDRLAPDPDKIVLYAYSLGGIPAVEQAVQRPGCALILEAPFPSLQNFTEGTTTLTLRDQMLSDGQFDNVDKIRDHRGPLLAMTGANDGLIPPEYVLEVAENNGGPTQSWVVPGAEHGIADLGIPEVGLRAYLDRIDRFLDTTPCR